MLLSIGPALMTIASGGVVGAMLSLVGGGGSILAVPLLVYFAGVASPHVAIGTAAVAVAINAAVSLATHARHGNVKWPCAIVFASSGIAGTLLGTHFGKALDGKHLMFLFGLVMIAVGLSMLWRRSTGNDSSVQLNRASAKRLLPRLTATGLGAGTLAGFFGIGGGFLIVPGLVYATGMPLTYAIGSSLVAVTAFGLTTAGSYAASGQVDWSFAALLIAGGVAGSFAGTVALSKLRKHQDILSRIFGSAVVAVGSIIAFVNEIGS